jgi:hypothetical protein
MYAYVLHPDETLEAFQKALEGVVPAGRPVLVAGANRPCGNKDTKLLYRLKGVEVPLSTIGLFLSQWRWRTNPDCPPPNVWKTTPEERAQFTYELDLLPAKYLKFLVPALPGDLETFGRSVTEPTRAWPVSAPLWFQDAGVPGDINGHHTLEVETSPEDLEEFPELSPYLQAWRKQGDPPWRADRQGVRFWRSCPVENPLILQEGWFLDAHSVDGDAVATLCPPGQYHGDPHLSLEEFNQMCLVQRAAGSCVVCRGRSGCEDHIANMGSARHRNLVCKPCFKQAVVGWLGLLENWNPKTR